ncbi:MAG: N-acyl homoserine lactonase family protein [Gammaproteobacteria bacterium]|nr:N-acyl homoserine lactonase family protein [Gammaproteobacteria bacterium]
MRTRLFLLDLGRMHMQRSGFLGDLPKNDPIASEVVEFPISACLIDGPQGRILYDAGCHPDAMKPNGRWPQDFQSQFPWSGDESCHLPNRLEQLGLGADDIDHVVLSHLHSDHAGCVEFFSNSQVIVHRNEFDAALLAHKRREDDGFYAWRDIEHWRMPDLNWRLVEEQEEELSITEQVTLLNWGAGHSAGMLGLELSLPESGQVILASDAVYSLDNLGPPLRSTGFNFSSVKAAQTVEKIRVRALSHNAQIWCGHDMSQFLSLRRSTDGWYE